jgi:sorting nexin-14
LNFGKIIKNVPKKLLHKERGQNLDPFLAGFVASTEAPKPRPSKLEFRDVAVEDAELRR